ncbi:hypothetical protein KBD33_04140 [Candidatus Gracilibacteria bacterium]|nr:hypothetical protein [Candidatus Gracilibacteria bacterium]
MSFTLSVPGRELGPYEAIQYPNGDIKGDIKPILYDTASIHLLDQLQSFALCYKESKNLSGKKVSFVDVVNMESGEFYSLQVSNIYYFNVFAGIPHIIGKVGNNLVYYEKFGKSLKPVEADGDKHELTPLGAFDMFLTYDDNYFYPLIFSEIHRKIAKIKKFYDYYGWRSYVDPNGGEHFVMMIEDERSTEDDPYWYWVDNFVPISEKIILDDDQYVEDWNLDPYGNIKFTITNGSKYHIDKNEGSMVPGWDGLSESTNFSFIREYDDTDADEIVGKNENGSFIIDRNLTTISREDQKKIIYFPKFVWCLSPSEADRATPCFLMMKDDGQIVLVDSKSQILCGTDLKYEYDITTALIQKSLLTVTLSDKTVYTYIIV